MANCYRIDAILIVCSANAESTIRNYWMRTHAFIALKLRNQDTTNQQKLALALALTHTHSNNQR